MIPPVLHTPRLVLRAPTLADAPRWEMLCQPLEMAKNTLRMPHPYPKGAAEEWFKKVDEMMARGEACRLAIYLRESDLMIGMVGLHDISDVHRHAELGYSIGMDYWGKGYASEAASAMVDHAFASMCLERVHAGYYTRNAASARILDKLGFKHEGLRPRMYCRFGEWVDLVLVGLLRGDWEKRRRAAPATGR